MQWASENTPNNARFAVYGESRCFYLKRDYFFADDANNNLIDYEKIKSAADLLAALREQGATHVLWNTVPGENGGSARRRRLCNKRLTPENCAKSSPREVIAFLKSRHDSPTNPKHQRRVNSDLYSSLNPPVADAQGSLKI